MSVSKFAQVHVCTTADVKGSTAQNAETKSAAGAPGGAARLVRLRGQGVRSALDLGPFLLPDRVVHAVLLAVPAVRDRRLPELDAVEVGRGSVRVVLGASALLDLVHELARLQVRRRLAERERLLRL